MTSTDRRYFQEKYSASQDPWNFSTSWYEKRKYALTIGALPNERYANAFEPGCSIGVLSEMLASRCDRVLSTDIMDIALELARSRTAPLDNLRVEYLAIPEQWPREIFDLVVISEVAYYFDEPTLAEIIDLVIQTTESGAHIVGVHWRGVTDYPLSAQEVHRRFDQCTRFRRIVHHEDNHFLLDVWERI